MLYAYILTLKFSSKCIDPNYFFYWFECLHMICPNLSSAPCRGEIYKTLYSSTARGGTVRTVQRNTITCLIVMTYSCQATEMPPTPTSWTISRREETVSAGKICTVWYSSVLEIGIRIWIPNRRTRILPDPDPLVRYGFKSVSFHHQAKIVRKNLIYTHF